MQSTLNEPDADAWPQIAPLLDDALGKLGEKDRNALVLRFFENKSLAEVGAALGASEDAAKMRVNRALEKLRKIFGKRGVTLSATVIAGAVSANSVHAAPVALAKTISTVAITKGAAAGGSTLALVKGALKIMAWTKAKTAIVGGAVVLLAAAGSTHIWYYHMASDSWRHRLDSAYRLRYGEVLRYIPAPFIPERMTFYRTNDSVQAEDIPAGWNTLVFRQDKQGQLVLSSAGFGPPHLPLRHVLRAGFGFKPYEFEGDDRLLNLTVNGDWTLRQDISREALLKALEPILWRETKHHIVFEKRTVERDFIVVTGDHFTAPQPGTVIQLYAEKFQDIGYHSSGDLNRLLTDVGDKLGMSFIDETKIDAQPPDKEVQNLTWTIHSDCDAFSMRNRRVELTNKVLKNIADQTGVTFTREQRPIDVWFVSEKP